MNKTRTVIIASVAVYVVALVVAWMICTRNAMRNTERMLAVSETVFAESIDDSIAALLAQSALAVREHIGNSARPLTVDETQEIARRCHIDEVNVVDRNGIAIGSNIPRVLGADFRAHEETIPFLELTNNADRLITQPFRHGVNNPEDYCKYAGIGFEDLSGFIQLGFSFDRLARVLDRYDNDVLRHWAVGRSGHFDLADAEYLPKEFPDGKVFSGYENGRKIFFRGFTYAGYRYVSVLPEQEYFDGRDVSFSILAPVLAGIVLLLLLFVRSLIRAESAEKQRRAAEDASRARDLDMARAIQLSCLAPIGPFRRDVMSLTFDVISKPAREVGGDFYDVYFIDASHLAFVVADVAGKGISAAMFMMMAKNEIFNAMNELKNPINALTEANHRICRNNDANMFVTAWVGIVDIVSGKMMYINAGHNRPFIRRSDGTVVKECGRGGMFLGMFPEAKYQMHGIELHEGDSLFLYTDGVTEAMNSKHELYGEKRLMKVLASSEAVPGKIISAVENDVGSFTDGAEQSDDFTALSIVWHGAPRKYVQSFTSSFESIGAAIQWLDEKICLADKKTRSRLLNASDEIIANVVSYSGSTEFSVSVENAPDRTRVEIADNGAEYNQLSHAAPDVHVPIGERQVGGLGILIIKRLVDSATYRRENGLNVLTILAIEPLKPLSL